MKKLVSLLLAAFMLLSGAKLLPISAESAQEYQAPVFYGVQTAPGETEATQNVRFVSVVSNLLGNALGYRITAEFTVDGVRKSQVYSVEAGDSGMESSTVYQKIFAGAYNEEVTAEELGELVNVPGAVGLFALCIEEVPVNIGEILFTVQTYVKSGGELKAESESRSFIMENGKCSEKMVICHETFDGITENADLATTLQELGWQRAFARNWGGSLSESTATVSNGALKLDGGWDLFQMLPDGALSGFTSYQVDMDISIERLGVLDILFNHSASFQTFADAKTLTGTGNLLMFRDQTGAGTDGGATAAGTNCMQIKYCTFSGESPTVVTAVKDQTRYGEAFHLTLDVNNAEGKLSVLVNGTTVISAENIRYNLGSSVCVIAQCSPVTVYQLTVCGTPVAAQDGQVLFSQDFEEYTVGAKPFVNAFGTFGQSVAEENGNKYLALTSAWAAGELVPGRDLYGLEAYTVEADITMNAGSFLNFFFNDSASLADIQDKKTYSVANSKFTTISLRGECSNAANKSFNDKSDQEGAPLAFHVYNYDVNSAGSADYYFLQDSEGEYYGCNIGKDKNLVRGTAYHVAFVIDNSRDTATISIFVDGVCLAVVSGYNKDIYSGFYCWTQNGSGAKLDNLTVTAGAKYTAVNE